MYNHNLPTKLEKARPNYTLAIQNALANIRTILAKADVPVVNPHEWYLDVECIGLYDVTARYWITAELNAAGWGCVFGLRDSQNENIRIYMVR